MAEPDDKIVEYERLNWLGKAVYLGGAVVRGVAQVIDVAIDRGVDIWLDAEKAFKQAADPSIEEAKVLDEYKEGGEEDGG